MINWKVRLKNKHFWLSLIPALVLLVQALIKPFEAILKKEVLSEELMDIVNALFLVLTILGVVNDPTTDSFTDSSQALDYEKPRKD